MLRSVDIPCFYKKRDNIAIVHPRADSSLAIAGTLREFLSPDHYPSLIRNATSSYALALFPRDWRKVRMEGKRRKCTQATPRARVYYYERTLPPALRDFDASCVREKGVATPTGNYARYRAPLCGIISGRGRRRL
jgi:hypothetical protein